MFQFFVCLMLFFVVVNMTMQTRLQLRALGQKAKLTPSKIPTTIPENVGDKLHSELQILRESRFAVPMRRRQIRTNSVT